MTTAVAAVAVLVVVVTHWLHRARPSTPSCAAVAVLGVVGYLVVTRLDGAYVFIGPKPGILLTFLVITYLATCQPRWWPYLSASVVAFGALAFAADPQAAMITVLAVNSYVLRHCRCRSCSARSPCCRACPAHRCR